jgi:uncharacterized short protein YbdD (DUF466 family)
MRTKSRIKYEFFLNGLGIPDHARYGSWMRKNDPIAFNVGYGEFKNN